MTTPTKTQDAAFLYEQGRAFGNSGDAERAIEYFQRAADLQPDVFSYWLNLGRACVNAGQSVRAAAALSKAKNLKPDDAELWALYAAMLQQWQGDFVATPEMMDNLALCLTHRAVDPEILNSLVYRLFLSLQCVQAVKRGLNDQYGVAQFEDLIRSPQVLELNHPVYLEMLKSMPIRLELLEFILIALRVEILKLVACGKENLVLPLLPFVSALAAQCFLNEYVYPENAEEGAIITDMMVQPRLSAAQWGIIAAYRSLGDCKDLKSLKEILSDHPSLKFLWQQQVKEPEQERKIKSGIKSFTKIDDAVSALVKGQYEQNPYPRWTRAAIWRLGEPAQILKSAYPFLTANDLAIFKSRKHDILIAGCGSGKQAIEVSQAMKDVNITAIDLSTASLSYAIRKAQDLGAGNITFGLGDILQVGEIGKTYDIIYCSGVLHHMEDPVKGWRRLYDCLNPGGFMDIALYSTRARRQIFKARELIAENGYKDDREGIRACREHLKRLPKDHPARRQFLWGDFFTVSTCRDLLFHVQEHTFTPLQIKAAIDELGLRFIGFHFYDPRVMPQFAQMFPDDPQGRNLVNWDAFEQQFPDTFIGMFQFWVQKK